MCARGIIYVGKKSLYQEGNVHKRPERLLDPSCSGSGSGAGGGGGLTTIERLVPAHRSIC
jgi:hypothetical protein